MRSALWPDQTERDMEAWCARSDAVTFVAVRTDGRLCGFIEAGTRSYAEGCQSTPVPYVEGWYVDADVRRSGVGAALVDAVTAWARAQGFRELASDADVANAVSQAAHRHLGFEEVDRAVHYRMPLSFRIFCFTRSVVGLLP
jgi:aminoglycoside 6'-N-acetyltransferase I